VINAYLFTYWGVKSGVVCKVGLGALWAAYEASKSIATLF
jgi:hypothetical protein